MTGPLEPRIRTAFVLHVMQVAGAEVLVAETIRRLSAHIEPVVFCLDGVGELGERLQHEGVPVLNLGRRPGLDLAVARRMAVEIADRRVEVVHAHQYTPFFYAAMARLCTRQRVNVMFTEHGRHFPDIVSAKRRWANRLVFSRLADEINGVSAFSVRSLYEVEGFRGHTMDVIHNGIDLDRHRHLEPRPSLRPRLGFDLHRRYIACVARFHPVKDHRTLLYAFAIVAAQRSDTDLLLAGDGPLRGELQELSTQLGIATRVKFLGIRPDVPEILAAADLFVLTSVSEAASITLLEAMASGTPSVVTAVGGNPEIVRDGLDGLLVPRGDASAIAQAILSLLGDAEKAARMGEEARRRVVEHFQLKDTVSEDCARYTRAAERLRALR